MANPTISILIPTSGNNPLLKDCLASIKKLKYPQTKIQTIVITNQDLHKAGKEFSFAASVNHAAKKAEGAYLIITNDDIVFGSSAVRAWLDAAGRFPNTILGAKLYDLRNRQVPSGYTMNLWSGIARPVIVKETSKPCDWVSGCALLIKRQDWERLGGFDEGFQPGFFEDFDLCLRARKKGIRCLLWPKAIMKHAETTTFNKDKPKKYEYWYRNKLRFLLIHASPAQILTNLILQYCFITPARALLFRDGRFIPALKGLAWNLKGKR